ncbi:MAG: hypothetical protein SGCHY_004013 [Lobulomycetales sp.]
MHRAIRSQADLDRFPGTVAFHSLTGFIQSVNYAPPNKQVPQEQPPVNYAPPNKEVSQEQPPAPPNKEVPQEPAKDPLLELLASLLTLVEKTPPVSAQPHGQRFGNPAFRSFLDALPLPGFWPASVPTAHIDACIHYWKRSWGDYTRLDYGSGHELNFIVFLICLFQIRVLEAPKDLYHVKAKIMPAYLDVTRALQTTYKLEPAGTSRPANAPPSRESRRLGSR